MKEIVYRGGLVRFKIPESWIDEYGEDSGGIFYEDTPNSGTLRLDIISAKSSTDFALNESVKVLTLLTDVEPSSIRSLPNGNAIGAFVQRTSEDEVPITIFWWVVSNLVPPRHVRIANFSYTVLTSCEHDSHIIGEVALLADSIARAEFHPFSSDE